MKAILNAIIAISMANLLAIGGFVGWLLASDRIDMERVREIRMILSVTITDQRATDAAAKAKADADAVLADEAAKAAKPPLTAAEKLAARVEATDLDREKATRLRREVESLQQRLSMESVRLADAQSQLDADKKAFEETVAATNARIGDEQFQKSLGILASLKPAAAKSLLQQMITGDSSSTMTTNATIDSQEDARLTSAIAYLDAMEERPRSKIMAEFAKDDPALATRLLEKLRIRGLVAKSP